MYKSIFSLPIVKVRQLVFALLLPPPAAECPIDSVKWGRMSLIAVRPSSSVAEQPVHRLARRHLVRLTGHFLVTGGNMHC